MGPKNLLFGKEMERMPNIAFRTMSFMFKIADIFYPLEKKIAKLGIREGMTVVDYGCGPGRHLEKVSRLVGEKGKVYAADIHELAIKSVKKKIEKHNLKNVEPVLVDGYSCDIENNTVDMVYAFDMFHMIKDPVQFLKELHRIIKKQGFLIIEDGHQPRKETKKKIAGSNLWNISEEMKDHLRCTPV